MKKIKSCVPTLIIFLWLVAGGNVYASTSDEIIVSFGGVYTAGNENHFPVYSRNKKELIKSINNVLDKMVAAKQLPFSLLLETDAEARKLDIDAPLTLAVIITRDDAVNEKFSTAAATIHKTIVNVGLVIIIYQTGKDESGRERNTIIYSLPLVGYSVNLEGNAPISGRSLDDLFIKTARTTIEEHLVKRLKGVTLERIVGTVTDVTGGKATINMGSHKGLIENQTVTFLKGRKKIEGRVISLHKDNSIISPKDSAFIPQTGMACYSYNSKGLSDETYQVVGFRISSKKAAHLFDEKIIGSQVSQWLSDFIADRSGKVVLPSKVGGHWLTTATEQSFMKLIKDGKEHVFEVPPPKYPLFLDLTGIASKMTDKNNVSEIWGYKAWVKMTIPTKGYAKEFSETSAKSVVPGIQSFYERDEMYDVLHQLTARMAREVDL